MENSVNIETLRQFEFCPAFWDVVITVVLAHPRLTGEDLLERLHLGLYRYASAKFSAAKVSTDAPPLAQESTYAQCLSLEIESNGRGHDWVHKKLPIVGCLPSLKWNIMRASNGVDQLLVLVAKCLRVSPTCHKLPKPKSEPFKKLFDAFDQIHDCEMFILCLKEVSSKGWLTCCLLHSKQETLKYLRLATKSLYCWTSAIIGWQILCVVFFFHGVSNLMLHCSQIISSHLGDDSTNDVTGGKASEMWLGYVGGC